MQTAETRFDPYPSRVSEQSGLIERVDPVVYPGVPGPLSEEQMASYRDNGFLFLENLFSPAEVENMRREMTRLWNESQQDQRPEVIREPDSEAVRSVFAVHRDDPFFSSAARDDKVVSIARQILGSDVYIHQSRVNFKPGFEGKEFYWHSDFETWHVEDGMPRMRALSMSITLTDNTSYNGPLMVMPGSHLWYVSCGGQTPKDHYKQSLRKQEYGVPDHASLQWLYNRFGIEVPVGKAGSVLIFDCNIMHGSNGNITPLPRSNFFVVYNSVENRLERPFSDLPPRPDFLGERAPA